MKPRRFRASAHNERGRELADQGLTDRAIAEYQRATEIDPKWAVPFYNLGLVHKYAGNWTDSLRMNQRAVELDDTSEGSWWNLGIAATALGDWAEARRAWAGCGVGTPPREDPVAYPCGLAPIRLNPDGDAEVVWADRIDPARAILRNVPYPSSGFRFGDLVLNDGAPTGYRMLSGREVPVFNCLELLERSSQSTFLAEIEMGEPSDIDLLARMADDRDMAAEDWSTSVRILCKACSEGLVHDQHDHNIPAVEGLHKVAVAGPDQHAVEGLLAAWREQSTSATILSIDLLLDAAAS